MNLPECRWVLNILETDDNFIFFKFSKDWIQLKREIIFPLPLNWFFVQTSFSLNQQDLFCMNPNLGWYVGKSCAKVKQIFPRSIWQRGEQPSRNICLSVDDTFFFAIHRAHLKSVCKRNWYLLNPDSSQIRGKLCTSKTNLFDQINLSWS